MSHTLFRALFCVRTALVSYGQFTQQGSTHSGARVKKSPLENQNRLGSSHQNSRSFVYRAYPPAGYETAAACGCLPLKWRTAISSGEPVTNAMLCHLGMSDLERHVSAYTKNLSTYTNDLVTTFHAESRIRASFLTT